MTLSKNDLNLFVVVSIFIPGVKIGVPCIGCEVAMRRPSRSGDGILGNGSG
jgi:hypothetical protein